MPSKTFWKLLGVFLIWRVGLFIVSAIAPSLLKYRASFPYSEMLSTFHLPLWLAHWGGFDGVHYVLIAQLGYLKLNFVQAFFPLFPEIILRSLFLVIPNLNVL